jgi:hypothetical protein
LSCCPVSSISFLNKAKPCKHCGFRQCTHGTAQNCDSGPNTSKQPLRSPGRKKYWMPVDGRFERMAMHLWKRTMECNPPRSSHCATDLKVEPQPMSQHITSVHLPVD